MKNKLRDPITLVLAALAVAIVVGCARGLPGSDSWAADSISPRSCGLGAVVENFLPGHFHIYPPLHMGLLTVLSLPWIALAASRVGTNIDALGAELVKPFYMTPIEASARAVSAAMALAIVWNTARLWTRISGRHAGIFAALVVTMNPVFVYYAHTGNLEVPYLFWLTWGLVEIDRVAAGEPREIQVLLLAVAAVLTKDQAAGVLLLPIPIYMGLVPWAARREPLHRRNLVRGAIFGVLAYVVGSGALVNPSGFQHRIHTLFGSASRDWVGYGPGMAGTLALARDAVRATTEFTSWPLAVASVVGVILVITSRRRDERWRALLPLVAAISFFVFFNLGARRTEARFLLPESLLFLPYAAFTFDHAWTTWPRTRTWLVLASAAAFAPAALGVASMDATLLADPRYAAERFLASLPAGTHVEVYGGPIFLPRVPSHLVAVRPGVEPIAERQHVNGVAELVDLVMDPRPRGPAVIVLASELSSLTMTLPAPFDPYRIRHYQDPRSRALFRSLLDGSLGYRRVLRATCSLPWPLDCRSIHQSTAGEIWIYAPERSTD